MARIADRVRLTLISSRIGRRVAALFVLCGLVPLVALATVTLWSVSAHLRQEEERRLSVIAKAATMHALGRLLDVEDQLRFAGTAAGLPSAHGRVAGVLGIVGFDREGRGTRLAGAVDVAQLPLDVRARLEAGTRTLRFPARASEASLLFVPAPADDPGARLGYAAALDLGAIWALDDNTLDERGTRRACLVAGGAALACTENDSGRDVPLPAVDGGRGAGVFTLRADGEEWMGAYWAAPLQAHYGVPALTGVVLTPAADAVAPAHALLQTVALVTMAGVCLALLVSFGQIRRLLDPLGRVRAATTRLAQGDFEARVDVDTGDEIQELGAAFNAMAGDLQRQFAQLHALSVGTLEALARAIDAKSSWTAGHSTRVARIAVAIARTMGYDAHALDRIARGALLHDIGKIALSQDILDRPGPLSAAEMALVREHPAIGARILEPLPHCADILPMVLQHHERPDGRGYPAGLAGDAIALDARILTVADVYDAMTSHRPYRAGLDPREALDYLWRGRGTHVDAGVVDAFVRRVERDGLPQAEPEIFLDQRIA